MTSNMPSKPSPAHAPAAGKDAKTAKPQETHSPDKKAGEGGHQKSPMGSKMPGR